MSCFNRIEQSSVAELLSRRDSAWAPSHSLFTRHYRQRLVTPTSYCFFLVLVRVVRSSVRSFVCLLPNWKRDSLETNKPISMNIGTTGPRGTGVKRSTLGVRRTNIKVTRGRSYIWRPGGGVIFDPYGHYQDSNRFCVCLCRGRCIRTPWSRW